MSTALHGLSNPTQSPAEGPDDAHAALRATVERRGNASIVHFHGEVDAYTLPTWRSLLREVVTATAAPGIIVIDTGGLGFMACRSMLALAEEAEACRLRDVRLCVVGNQLVVTRIVTLLDLDALQPIYACVEDALAGSVPSGHYFGGRAAG
ncbi:anti-sigma factor antagonist [Nocardia sp. NPDC057455]|uniref:anti-sigma factor antagonist n=1 Tax=Nocardia sp. NPDC057455 TaxID=3346138 RepID=UPI00366F3C60